MSSHTKREGGSSEPETVAHSGLFSSPLLVPVGGFAALAVLSFILIGVIILRPWSGPDESWRTHLNLTDEPLSGYSRGVQSFVSPEGAARIEVWRKAECDDTGKLSTCGDDPVVPWVANGCASCHGLDATGGEVGPNLMEATPDLILNTTRFGPVGMPKFGPLDLTEEHLASFIEYIAEMRIANPGAVQAAIALKATPTPVSEFAPSNPSTAADGESPAPSEAASNSDLLARGRLIFNKTAGGTGCAYCHGLDGKGEGIGTGETAPDIRGLGRSEVRQAIRGNVDMQDIKLSNEDLMAVIEYLQHLNK